MSGFADKTQRATRVALVVNSCRAFADQTLPRLLASALAHGVPYWHTYDIAHLFAHF
jgi:hypothetical protein